MPLIKVEGYVYCHDHTVVHEDTQDPYEEGREAWCRKEEHRTLYYRTRKGDDEEKS